MGNNAFSDCRNIRLINDSPYFQYVNGVLYDKNATTCMHYSMGSGVKVVELLDTVRTIGRNCFWNCDMIEKLLFRNRFAKSDIIPLQTVKTSLSKTTVRIIRSWTVYFTMLLSEKSYIVLLLRQKGKQ